jgi:mycothiol synthase
VSENTWGVGLRAVAGLAQMRPGALRSRGGGSPPLMGGELTLRAATVDDAECVAEVLNECTTHYFNRPTSAADALARLGQSTGEGDALLACDEAGRPLGFGHLWGTPSDEMRCFVRVRPNSKDKGVATALLSHFVERARGAGAETLTLTSWAQDPDALPVLESHDFAPVRYFVQMRTDLAATYERRADWPDGIELHTYERGQDDAELFSAYADAFAEHWGQDSVEEADWWDGIRDADTAGFDPTLWFLARSDQTIAGFSICRELEDEGETVGWVSLIGVRPSRRVGGLGDALLAHSLTALRRRGLARAALNVDAENTTGALRLYRKAGMEPRPAFTVWSKAF